MLSVASNKTCPLFGHHCPPAQMQWWLHGTQPHGPLWVSSTFPLCPHVHFFPIFRALASGLAGMYLCWQDTSHELGGDRKPPMAQPDHHTGCLTGKCVGATPSGKNPKVRPRVLGVDRGVHSPNSTIRKELAPFRTYQRDRITAGKEWDVMESENIFRAERVALM